MIFVEHDTPISQTELDEKLDVIKHSLSLNNPEAIVGALHQVVPTYVRPETVNNRAEHAPEMKLSRGAAKLTPKSVSGWS